MKTFIVLGMHKSATSLISGGIEKMGVNIGSNMLGTDTENPKSYFENIDFMNLKQKNIKKCRGKLV